MKVKATDSALKLIEELKAQHVMSFCFINQVVVVMEVLLCVTQETSIWLDRVM